MTLADDIDAYIAAHPESVAALKKHDEDVARSTVDRKILSLIEENGRAVNAKATMVTGRFGRFLYRLGNESALMQVHVEDGTARLYTSMIDLQQAWWREAFLNNIHGGDMNIIGLIEPSVLEVLEQAAPQVAEKFHLSVLMDEIGKHTEGVGAELEQNMLYAKIGEDPRWNVTASLQTFLKEVVAPEFDVKVNAGSGDMVKKLRLIPRTIEARDALINGGALLDTCVKKIVDSRPALIEHLRSQLSDTLPNEPA